MARLEYLNKEDLSEDDQDLLSRPINLNRILVNSPGIRRAGQQLGKYIRYGSGLDPRLRELAILQVGYLALSSYEWSHHIKLGQEFGVTEADIRGLIDVSEGRQSTLDEDTLLVLSAARESTLQGGVSAPTFHRLQQRFNNRDLVDLIVTIAHYNGMVRILASLEVDVEPEYLPYLAKYPLPARNGGPR